MDLHQIHHHTNATRRVRIVTYHHLPSLNRSSLPKSEYPLAPHPETVMAPSVDYHCACASEVAVPPPPSLASSSASFHPLHELFFCEECDAVRCNRCVSVEVSGYYCPNCLFEVPSASVRAEKNRCVRMGSRADIRFLDIWFILGVLAIAFFAHVVETRSR